MSEQLPARTLWRGIIDFALFNPLFLLAAPAAVAAGLWGTQPIVSAPLRPDLIAEVEGWIQTAPERADGLLYFELKPESVRLAGRRVGLKGRVAVYVYSNRGDPPSWLEPPLVYGERIRLRCFLTEPSHFAVPGVADFRRLQRLRGVSAVARLKSLEQIERTGGRGGCPLLRPLFAYGGAFRRFCAERFEGSRRSLILSAFLGEKRGLEESERERVRRLGAFHLFVVSGFHVSLVLAVFHLLLGRFGGPGRLASLAAMWGYVLLAGASPSGLRAGLMTSFFYLLWGFGLGRAFLNGLGLAALLMLAVRPALVSQAGFQFSFLSLAAIGLFAAPWRGWLRSVKRGFSEVWSERLCLDRDPDGGRVRRIRYRLEEWTEFLPRRWSRRLLRLAGAAAAGMVGLLVCNLWIQLLTFPLGLRYSNRLVWTQAAANLVLVPLFTLFVPVCLALFSLFATPLAEPAAILAGWSADGLLWVMSSLERCSVTSWIRHPGAAATVAHVFLLPAAATLLPGRWKAAVFAAPLLYLGWARLDAPPATGWLTVTMLDVGQGESIHIRYPDGLDALVDTGGLRSPSGSASDFVGERLVGRYLWELGVRRLEYVLLTHPHVDHIQGLRFVRRAFPLRALLYFQWDDGYGGVPGLRLKKGDSLIIGGVEHRVMHPDPRGPWSVNDASLVIMLRYRDFSMLLTGDIEKRAEWALADSLPPVTALKVPHHGGRSSATEQLLRAVQPRAALISAGRRNLFGHPSQAVLTRLVDGQIPVFTTAVSGSLRLETDGRVWRLSRYSIRDGRFLAALEERCAPEAEP